MLEVQEEEAEEEALEARLVGAPAVLVMEVATVERGEETGPHRKIGSDGRFLNISDEPHTHLNPPSYIFIPLDHFLIPYLFSSLNILAHCTVYGDGVHVHFSCPPPPLSPLRRSAIYRPLL